MSENDKSEDAFRTIAEVSSILGVEQHALRYWESQFKQVSPVRRRGNRRLYRPSDINLIAGLRKLLHEDNHTLKAAQKFLDKMGTEHVASLGAEFLHGAGSPGNTPKASEQEPTGPAGSRDAADEAVASSEPDDTASPESKSVTSVSTVGGEPGTEAEPVCEELETETPKQKHLIEAAEEVLVVNLTVRNRSYSFSSKVVGELSPAEFEHLRQLVGRLETLRRGTEADIKRLRSKFGLASTP
ncbi:MAG: MerR family transcriptional regulator [Rhodobacteraceae bacterium]|nr:MerR family transcriptional regulator [Paracoccaceae bacterium]